MPIQLIEEQVNLYDVPKQIHHENETLVIGDLHGNAVKLMYFLVKHGFATKLSEDDYENLALLLSYDVNEITSNHVLDIKKRLSCIEWKNSNKILLLGDDLCDRMFNDYWTLLIYEQLVAHKISIEFLISNHNIEFILATELSKSFKPPKALMKSMSLSMANLQQLIEDGVVELSEVQSIVDNAYKPNLKCLGYHLMDDKKSICLYSHAPIDLEIVKSLAKFLSVSFQDDTPELLALSIDAINRAFSCHVKNKTVHQLLHSEKLQTKGYGYILTNKTPKQSIPFELVIWNRDYSILNRKALWNEYPMTYVHGHNFGDDFGGHIYNLNNTLGISFDKPEGTYQILSIDTKQPSLSKKPMDIAESSFNDSPFSFFNGSTDTDCEILQLLEKDKREREDKTTDLIPNKKNKY